ncbi:alpha/beta hydrolase [Angustibacter speluncae]
MNLEPEVLAHLQAGDPTGIADADPVQRRVLLTREIDRMFRLFGLPGPDVDRVRDHHVPVDGGTILVRSYHPVREAEERLPVHVLVHGGGWTTGSVDELVCDATARHRTAGARCVTVLVDYRLAPELPFPVPLDDTVAAVRWVRDHADELGIDPGALTLGGASAGANLCAAAVLAAPDLDVRALVLDVPALDLRAEKVHRPADLGDEWEELMALFVAQLEPAAREYLGDVALAESPLASPVLAEDHAVFPPTYLLTAELDVLRPGAEEFARRLEAAGVPVDLRCYPGALHGSAILTASWGTARRWHDETLEILADIHDRTRMHS